MDVMEDNLYSQYNDTGFSWALTLSTLPIVAVAFPGMFMNIALIWVTITKSKFHGTSNILLAQCAFYEIIHEIGILIMFYFNLMGINFLTYSQTVAVFFIPIFAASGIGPLFVFTGLDRMLCVLFPTFPNQIRPRIYLTLISVICALYCAIFPVGFYWFNNIDPDTLVPPTFNDIFSRGTFGTIYTYSCFILYNIAIILYVAVGILVKIKSDASSSQHLNCRLYRSLLIIIIFNLGGYYIMRVFSFWIYPLLTNQISAWFIRKAVSILLNISAASNAPVLYFTSSDYKTAFIQIFTNIPLLKSKISPNINAATGHTAAVNRLQIQQKLMATQNANQIYPIPLK